MELNLELIGWIGGILVTVGTLLARFAGTNKEKKWYERVGTVLDATQIFDSTRKLDD